MDYSTFVFTGQCWILIRNKTNVFPYDYPMAGMSHSSVTYLDLFWDELSNFPFFKLSEKNTIFLTRGSVG
jgi:hypothetical protein